MKWLKRFGRFTKVDWFFFVWTFGSWLGAAFMTVVGIVSGGPVWLCVIFVIGVAALLLILIRTINFVTD